MMILRSADASPFGRKVKIAAAILGLDHSIRVEAADPVNPNDTLREQNPLGKIPVLLLEDGSALYDSRVIVEYLDSLAGSGRIVPAAREARFAALRLQALADGLMDACLMQVYEGRWRPAEKHEAKWVDHQVGKMTRVLSVLESSPPAIAAVPDIGAIALAAALGYLDLRFGGRWRAGHPRLVAWLDDFAARVPAFNKTKMAA